MKVKDKRRDARDLDRLGDLSPGVVVEFAQGLGYFTESLRQEYKTGFVLDRNLLLPENDPRFGEELRKSCKELTFPDMTPVAFFSGAFAWITSDMTVRCVDATVTIDHYDERADMPFIHVVEKKEL